MAITTAELQVLLSGGSTNTDPAASIGGAPSTTEVSSTPLHNIFDKITGDESAAGDTEYRVLYVKNNNSTLDGENCKVYFGTNESSYISIGVSEAVDTNAAALTDEETAPSGSITWTKPTTRSAAVTLGDLDSGSFRALYLRRVIPAGASADDSVDFSLKVEIDTPA